MRGSVIRRFVILGAPRTKNTGKVVMRGRVLVVPSAAYRRWYKSALAQAPILLAQAGIRTPIAVPVDVTAIFYRDRRTGDEDRYKNALGDYLQRARFIENDVLIHWTGETRRALDPA